MSYRIKRFFKLFKVALHKPYMLKAILTTRCPQCGRWLSFPKIIEQSFIDGVLPKGIIDISYTVDLSGLEAVNLME